MIKKRLAHGTVLVTFELPAAASATAVSVCGEFNDWSPTAHPLSRDEDGAFRTDVELAAGRRWQFRFLLDGERWENDWAADDYVANGHGGEDSVVDLTDVSGLATGAELAPGNDGAAAADIAAGAALVADSSDRAAVAVAPSTPGDSPSDRVPAKAGKKAAKASTSEDPATAKVAKKVAKKVVKKVTKKAAKAPAAEPAPAKATRKKTPKAETPKAETPKAGRAKADRKKPPTSGA